MSNRKTAEAKVAVLQQRIQVLQQRIQVFNELSIEFGKEWDKLEDDDANYNWRDGHEKLRKLTAQAQRILEEVK